MAAVKPRYSLWVLLLFIASTVLAKPAEDARSAVADLRYGVALYHYYQGEYMQGLTELLVADARGGIKGHGDNPEIMEGGFALAYGLEKYAGEIFDRLLAENRSIEASDAAWFFIARLRYNRQDWPGVDDAIAHISDAPPESVRDELIVLKINQAIKQNRLEEAEARLNESKKIEALWLPYVNFNMGAAWARAQEFEKAVAYFKALGKKEYKRTEHIALYDKAMTAAGYSYLLNEQPEKAIDQFLRVRRDSKHATRALLGYGWAAADMEDFTRALKPWSFLAKSNLIDENSQESLIAVPYAYEKLGSENLALENFKAAEQRFVEEIFRIEEVIANTEGDSILEALELEASEDMDWLRYAEENRMSPQIGYLIKLFSMDEFQSSAQEMRDLLAAQKKLNEWRNKLVFYTEMLAERGSNRQKKNSLFTETKLRQKIIDMEAQRVALQNRIDRISTQKDYFALAPESKNDLIERIQRAQANVEILRDFDPYIEDYDEAIRRYYGLLLWDASENYTGRMWRSVKALRGLDETIAQIRGYHANAVNILNQAPETNNFRARIGRANATLEKQIQLTDSAVERTKNRLRDQVSNVLVAQRNRLNHYLSQSRLSIARIYDKARMENLQSVEEDAALNQGAEDSQEKIGIDTGVNAADNTSQKSALEEQDQ